MIKQFATASLLMLALALCGTSAKAQMTDDAVLEYTKQAVRNGKSQNEIVKELTLRGVTIQQAERIKNRLEKDGRSIPANLQGAQISDAMLNGQTGLTGSEDYDKISSLILNPLERSTAYEEIDFGQYRLTVKDSLSTPVFGQSIFTNRNLSFAPSYNLPTPENYKLGPGDEVVIDIWGTNQASIFSVISPDGNISIENIGLVNLNGMTVTEANKYLKRRLGQIYSVDGADAESEIKLSLGSTRTIQVNVMGEVLVPGTYYLSSLSNIYHAIYSAGGVSELGSLRDIQLVRKGKKLTSVDIYKFIFDGEMPDDITLEEGDMVIVPTYKKIVSISGKVKRPLKYEMSEEENVQNLIDYAGGFTGDAYKDNISLIRRNGREYQVFTVDEADYPNFALEDGDSLAVGQTLNRYENKIEIKGAVYRPGIYQLGGSIRTFRELIVKADGLKGDAFTNRAIIQREKEDFTLETIAVDVLSVMNGSAEDIELKKNDFVYIPSIHELKDLGEITVKGEVSKPGSFPFAENTTIEDAIIKCGGLLESASTVKVDVIRRIKDPASISQSEDIAQIFTFSVKDGFVVDGQLAFHLEPYDYVFVRKSPSYSEQKEVRVEGEVTFPGNYTITQRGERISDLIEKAGGVNRWAYIKGARLSRLMNEEEKVRLRSTLDVMGSAKDSIDVNNMDFGERYYVGIDLASAIANPGGENDLALREGDILNVPQYVNTVRIFGNVLYPNTVTYKPGLKVRDYVMQAGGYGFRSKRSKAYIIYMNGTVARTKQLSTSVVEPGCEIVIPKKREKNEDILQNVLSVASTSASLATMIATIGNIVSNNRYARDSKKSE